MSRAIHYDDLPDGTVLRHAPCGEFYTVGVDEFWDAAEKPRCERCEVEDGDPYAGWHVATWVEAEFPELFDQGYAKLPDELWDYGHRLPLSSAELLVVGALWRHQSPRRPGPPGLRAAGP